MHHQPDDQSRLCVLSVNALLHQRLVLGLLCLVLTASAASAQPPFFANSGQSLGDEFTWAALVGDIDNDQDNDIVSLDGFNKVQVYLNDGSGLFALSDSWSFEAGTPHRCGALGYLNDDENLDLVIGGDGPSTGVSVYSGDGTGEFVGGWSTSWPFAGLSAIKLGDVDGNGSVDIVAVGFITDEASIQVCVHVGPDAYTCSGVASTVTSPGDAVLVDLDDDLDLDLAVASVQDFPDSSEIAVFLNEGGTFESTGQAIPAPYPHGLAAGDLDGDGDADLAVGNQASYPNQVLLNDGVGAFTDSGQALGGEASNGVVLGDVDLDDDLDLVAINEGHGGRGYVVYSNDGSGVFAEQEYGSNHFKSSGVLADVDGDADLDLVTGDYATSPSTSTGPNEVYVNNVCATHAPCSDTDGDGLRDDNCTWWECAAGRCLDTSVPFADIGGAFGDCAPDLTSDANDRFHALNCFADVDTLGQPASYPCEPSPPSATNVDAGGPFGECCPDGVCDLNDAFHALNAFAGENPCSCPANFVCPCTSPSEPPGSPVLCPPGPQPHAPRSGPAVTEQTQVRLAPAHDQVRPGEVFALDVILEHALADLRGYQLHIAAAGGDRGRLELLDLAIENRKDYVFADLAHWRAFNLQSQQMLAGLDAHGIKTHPGAYLATLTFRASNDAAGTFTVNLLGHDQDPRHRTFLLPTPAGGRIELAPVQAATVTISATADRLRGQH